MNFSSILNFYTILLSQYYGPGHPVLIGICAIGYCISILIGATIINALLSYTNGHIRQMMTICCALMTGRGGALAACPPFNPGLSIAMSTVAGFGIGGVLVPTTATSIVAAPDDWIATVTGLALCMRFIGGAVGNTIYFNIFNSKIARNLPVYLANYAFHAGLPASEGTRFAAAYVAAVNSGNPVTMASFSGLQGVTTQVLKAASLGSRWAYVESMKYV
jgi:hypothetical protein